MSQEALVKFFQSLENDPDLSSRLTAIEDPAEVARIAKEELGYDFTTEELASAVAAINKSPSDELSEEQLEAVAGGSFWDGRWTDNVRINLRFRGW